MITLELTEEEAFALNTLAKLGSAMGAPPLAASPNYIDGFIRAQLEIAATLDKVTLVKLSRKLGAMSTQLNALSLARRQ